MNNLKKLVDYKMFDLKDNIICNLSCRKIYLEIKEPIYDEMQNIIIIITRQLPQELSNKKLFNKDGFNKYKKLGFIKN